MLLLLSVHHLLLLLNLLRLIWMGLSEEGGLMRLSPSLRRMGSVHGWSRGVEVIRGVR